MVQLLSSYDNSLGSSYMIYITQITDTETVRYSNIMDSGRMT